MSKNKSKIVKWEYVTEPFDAFVAPATVKRAHSPLERSLSPHIFNGKLCLSCLHLRPCVEGVDADGAVVKYLYCTRDGRFFTRKKDGWNEIKTGCYGNNPKSKGGSSDCPQVRRYGWKTAHRCVAFAWLDVPKDVRLQMIGVDAPTKWEVDHLNTDHKNWTAVNLQWVTAEENRRRGKIARRMRKIGLDPKLLTRTLLLGIYGLPDERVGELLERFQTYCATDNSDLSIEHIRTNVAMALDSIRSTTTNN